MLHHHIEAGHIELKLRIALLRRLVRPKWGTDAIALQYVALSLVYLTS